MDDKSYYIDCPCGNEIIRLTRYDKDWEVCMSIFSGPGRPSLFGRLKHIWAVVKTGYPWEDQIVLTDKELGKLNEATAALANAIKIDQDWENAEESVV